MFQPYKAHCSLIVAIVSSHLGDRTSSHPRDVVHSDCHNVWQQPLSDTATVPTSTIPGLPGNAYNILRTWDMHLPVARISNSVATWGTGMT